jgi:hypothetical protein
MGLFFWFKERRFTNPPSVFLFRDWFFLDQSPFPVNSNRASFPTMTTRARTIADRKMLSPAGADERIGWPVRSFAMKVRGSRWLDSDFST